MPSSLGGMNPLISNTGMEASSHVGRPGQVVHFQGGPASPAVPMELKDTFQGDATQNDTPQGRTSAQTSATGQHSPRREYVGITGVFHKTIATLKGAVKGVTVNLAKEVKNMLNSPVKLAAAAGMVGLCFTPIAPVILPVAAAIGIFFSGAQILTGARSVLKGWEDNDLARIEAGAAAVTTSAAFGALSVYGLRQNLRQNGHTIGKYETGVLKGLKLSYQKIGDFKTRYIDVGPGQGLKSFIDDAIDNFRNIKSAFAPEVETLAAAISARSQARIIKLEKEIKKLTAGGIPSNVTDHIRLAQLQHEHKLLKYPILAKFDEATHLAGAVPPSNTNPATSSNARFPDLQAPGPI